MRILYVPVGSDYDSLINQITEKLRLPGPPDVKYKDKDGTFILITDDEDLALGIRSGDVWELDGRSRVQPEWDLWISL